MREFKIWKFRNKSEPNVDVKDSRNIIHYILFFLFVHQLKEISELIE